MFTPIFTKIYPLERKMNVVSEKLEQLTYTTFQDKYNVNGSNDIKKNLHCTRL